MCTIHAQLVLPEVYKKRKKEKKKDFLYRPNYEISREFSQFTHYSLSGPNTLNVSP
jgi:hypothetical protein